MTWGETVASESEAFKGRLLPNERVVWSGRPYGGLLFSARDLFLIPFSVLWLGFAIVWTLTAWRSGDAGFDLFGLVFVTFGLVVMVGRFPVDAWLRQGMTYAATNQRVLILKRRPNADFTALSLDRLHEVRISERGDGSGTVRFGPEQALFAFGRTGFSLWVPSLDPTPQFIAIADAKRVFDTVQRSAQTTAS
jgi:hypothetical protein